MDTNAYRTNQIEMGSIKERLWLYGLIEPEDPDPAGNLTVARNALISIKNKLGCKYLVMETQGGNGTHEVVVKFAHRGFFGELLSKVGVWKYKEWAIADSLPLAVSIAVLKVAERAGLSKRGEHARETT